VRFEESVNREGDIVWLPTTAGGARTNYEAATERVLRSLAAQDRLFSDLASVETLQHLGLKATGQRGRPKKAAA
jgi:hypothetical protein